MNSRKDIVTVLFIGDVVGKAGLDALTKWLPELKARHEIEFTIVNGENGAQGKGLTEALAKQYMELGADVITGGNHTWTHAEFRRYLDQSDRVLRPANYPDSAPGKGAVVLTSSAGTPIGVINLQGRAFMYDIDCPFRKADELIDRLRRQTPILIVDMHAEATAEKSALAWYLDGRVSAVIGTHTHVQTADERILPKGTAYLSDAGMTGPHDSVIGLDVQVAVKRFLSGIPEYYQTATANVRLNGVLIKIDRQTGRAKSIERINLPEGK
ncbi:MAG: TIGR00282 family metallophosphoesterase [candidate division KSB1 bacterium]|nr:TIGR00282 family metallophosphoesterase [candidate division KSB1 bacterium]